MHRLVPATHLPIGPEIGPDLIRIGSERCHCQRLHLPSLPCLAPRCAHLLVSLFLSFLYLYLWHTPLASSSPTSVFSLIFPTSLQFNLASHSPHSLQFDHLPQCVPPPIQVWPEPNKLLDSQLGELQNNNSLDFQLRPSDRIPLAHLGPPTPRELLLMLRWWNHLP